MKSIQSIYESIMTLKGSGDTIPQEDQYAFVFKTPKGYIIPKGYDDVYYAKKYIRGIRDELEEFYPEHKGNIVIFQKALIKTKL
jgi:hypothetical protein